MPTKPQYLFLKGIFFFIFNWLKGLIACILISIVAVLMVTILSGCGYMQINRTPEGKIASVFTLGNIEGKIEQDKEKISADSKIEPFKDVINLQGLRNVSE